MNGFIVLEGLNGSGKSTLSKLLVERTNGVYISTPSIELLKIRQVMDEDVSLLSRYYYYMLGNVLVSDQIKELRKTRFVVCDRFVHSTIAKHSLLGISIDYNIATTGIEKPDANFFINISDEDERIRRVNTRGKKTKWDILDNDSLMRGEYIKYFQNQNFNFIDNCNQSAVESTDNLVNKLIELKIIENTRV